jgi:hypothetical protein
MNAIRYVPFAGRLLIGLPFAMSGLSKLAAIGPTTDAIHAAGLPLPSLALAVSVLVEWRPVARRGFSSPHRRSRARPVLSGDGGLVPQ